MATIDKDKALALMHEVGLVPLFYHTDTQVAIEVLKACYRGGVRAFEFTNRGENAYDTFVELVRYAAEHLPGTAIGIGTIYDGETAQRFIDAGADFVIAPIMNPVVGAVCARAQVPWLPGISTLTEIYQAQQAGAEVVKLFPGEVVGSAFVRAIRGPMPKVKIMVTGGVQPTRESLQEWLGAGAYCVGMGSHLFPKEVLAARDYSWIEQKVAASVALIKELRAQE
ncbi:bifunctional 4-hydroxy-2-oxoglutarate aldolase/2-dehydro-3-deoxy-phosphogluconate aldolase [Rhabdobacter roseus]|uniref:2-dehydro-3-deoxyphosphogluconate aldolase/(4S)-4-hydroxy-2-oxoglutarate aldolase n=1 Tax=Rhabdobacter roseus TaxID=1655419 RepID=A0A840TPP9_9BACT|nr:bifunctional 4-hydroxy-2-oxoglutarate aldolase/2-dehydro-3-deoxy-phosphogluconate aldolase [Rhabdobacter roseus]MBB5282030.1 2-dehydro-3-deoxyphosphogluconate aldolase/(4S)-4-hydroxy-2-oxoglutarate aldolase [Rhabdobacter roseus]